MAFKFHTSHQLTICSWNAETITGKKDELEDFMTKHDIDIMCLNETKLKPGDKLTLRNHRTHRQDRQGGIHAAGGVAIIIKSSIQHARLPSLTNTNIEHVIIRLHDQTHIIAAYNRPQQNITTTDIEPLFNFNKVLVIGDLNAKHPTWEKTKGNASGTTLYNYTINNNAIIIHPNRPTHFPRNGTSPTCIDLAVFKNIKDVSKPEAVSELSSDHDPIILMLKHTNTIHQYKTVTSYRNTDWKQFRKTVDEKLILNNIITDTTQLDEAVEHFTKTLSDAKAKHTTQITINTSRDRLPQDILDLIRERNNARRVWQRSRNHVDKFYMNELSSRIRILTRNHKNQQWQNKLSALESGSAKFWKLAKIMKKPQPPMPTLEGPNNLIYSTDSEKAEAIADVFERVHHISTNNNQEQLNIIERANVIVAQTYHIRKHILSKLLTTPAELSKYIRALSNRKSPGPDNIDSKLIKNLSKKGIVQLVYIINAILKLQHFPTSWKTATVVPVPKPNKNHKLPNSYRPISLLSIISKLAEKIILDRVREHVINNNILVDYQFGFRQNHSPVQQAIRIITDVITAYNNEQVTTMTLLDIEKAFDRVWIAGLIVKLDKLKFPPHLIKLLHSYLTNRFFKVKVNGALSSARPILAGLPQGSCLGPELYAIFVNDVTPFAKTKLALFADDTAICATSFCAEVANKQTQIHANLLQKWWDLWKITINSDKTEQIVLTRKFRDTKIFTPLNINGHKTIDKPVVRYLGIYLDRRLKFTKHIKQVLHKAQITLYKLYPLMNRNSHLTEYNKKLLYTSVLRPIITYACPVWCGASPTAKLPLQRFQNKCLRLITNKDRYTRITDLHRLTGLPLLTDFINDTSRKFYQTQLSFNPLLTDLTLSHLQQRRNVHQLTYETIPDL